MTDPLGQAQVLPYLFGLSQRGHHLHLISCEKQERMARMGQEVKALCKAQDIHWHPLPYRQGIPIVSGWQNVRAMRRKAFALAKEVDFDWAHCRSYLAAMVGLRLQQRKGIKFLFDMRGFWPDERAESGLWNQKRWQYRLLYRFFKRKEAEFLSCASHIVVLTARAEEVVREQYEVVVGVGRISKTLRSAQGKPKTQNLELKTSAVPCCADFEHFPLQTEELKQQAKAGLGISPQTQVISYLGSLGTWYLVEEMIQLFGIFLEKNPTSTLLIISQDDPSEMYKYAESLGISPQQILLRPATRAEVPGLLMASDLGLMLIQPSFAKLASSPTKLAEYLAMGIPLITNTGIGDVKTQLTKTGGGVIVSDPFDPAALKNAVDAYQATTFDRLSIRRKARAILGIQNALETYNKIYRDS